MKKIFLLCVVVLALAVLPADADSLFTKWEAEAASGAVLSDPIPVMPTPAPTMKPHYPAVPVRPTLCPSCGYQP